jgi:hypothetical protein
MAISSVSFQPKVSANLSFIVIIVLCTMYHVLRLAYQHISILTYQHTN